MYITSFTDVNVKVSDISQNGKILNGQFHKFANNFKEPVYGAKKDGTYWVRGYLENGKRLNVNLKTLSMVVLDGDSKIDFNTGIISPGAPPAEDVHKALVKIGVDHFIYSSFSHGQVINGEKIHKWRAVIPIDDRFHEIDNGYDSDALKDYLKVHVDFVVGEINKLGVAVVAVKEMYTLSQPWFFPRRLCKSAEVDVAAYEYYDFFDGGALEFIERGTVIKSEVNNVPIGVEAGTYEASMNTIREGYTFHVEMKNIMYGKIKDGTPRANVITDMKHILMASKSSDPSHSCHDKWLREMQDGKVEKDVDETISKFKLGNQMDVVYVDKTQDYFTAHDWNSGFLGEFQRAIFERMEYPNKEISIIAAKHVISSLCGRKVSIDGSKMESANLMLASQGVGKNTPNKILSKICNGAIHKYLNKTERANVHCFEGSKGSYGVKALHEKMMSAPSMSVIIPEAGVNARSKAGDSASLSAYFMQNFTQDAYTKLYIQEFATKMPPVYGTVVARLEESTISSYKDSFTQDNLESGEVARRFIHFCSHKCDMEVKTTREPFSDHILSNLAKFVKIALYGENFFAKKEDGKFEGCTLEPLKKDLEMKFSYDVDAEEMRGKLKHKEMLRRNEVSQEGVEGMHWAIGVRRLEKAQKEALLYAYIEFVVGLEVFDDALFSDEDTQDKLKIKLKHMQEGLAYTDECDRGFIANSKYYNSAFDNLLNTILRTVFRCGNESSKSYKDYHSAIMIKHDIISARFLMKGGSAVKNSVGSVKLVYPHKHDGDILNQGLKMGQDLGYWKLLSFEEKEKYGLNSNAIYIQATVDLKQASSIEDDYRNKKNKNLDSNRDTEGVIGVNNSKSPLLMRPFE